jgi:hypothetical protein
MKMKIFSLMLIAVLAMSMVSSASDYGHGDIREGTLGYLSCSEYFDQKLIFTNNPDLSTNSNKGWYWISKCDDDAREYIDITKDHYDKYYGCFDWVASLNSEHVLRFWLHTDNYVTHSIRIDDVDYSKGLFIAAYYHGWGKQEGDVYYYDIYGRARATSLNYDPWN